MEKTCTKCQKTKPLDLFKADKRYGGGYSSYCKACHQVATIAWQKANSEQLKKSRRAWYHANRDKIRANRKKSYNTLSVRKQTIPYRYGITLDEYDEALKLQGGCAICGISQNDVKRRFSVDHDHSCCSGSKTCGKCVRGILCHSCNVSLNAVERVEKWAEKANQYLENYK